MKLAPSVDVSPVSPRNLSRTSGIVAHPTILSRKKHFQEVDFQLVMRPRQPAIPWDQFLYNGGQPEKYRLALDGYVDEATIIDTVNLVGNVDHHKNCDRLGTRATLGQIWMQIRAGLYQIFKNQYGPKVTAFVNGHDEDDAFATLLLEEPNLIIDDTHGHLRRLVWDCDELDSTAGMCAVNFNDPNYKKIFWITEPYRNSRNDIEMIKRKDVEEHIKVLREIQGRIKYYLRHPDDSPQLEADTRYDLISEEDGWVMIDETGNQARLGALADGHTAIISHKHMGTDNLGKDLHRYIFALTSADYHPYFPLKKMTNRLNEIEECTTDRWGGNSNTVIGSPLDSFSKIAPDKMLAYVRGFVKEARQ